MAQESAGVRYCIMIDAERCKGCELCVVVCPKHVIEMVAALNARGAHFAVPTHARDCVGCLQCCDICPDAAIEIAQEEEPCRTAP